MSFTQQRACTNKEDRSLNNATSPNNNQNGTCCHHHGFYCLECRKTVCMCTVKDHLVYKNDSTEEKDESNKMFDVVTASVLGFAWLPLLLSISCLTSLTCANVYQFTNSLCLDMNQYEKGISGEELMLTSSVSMNSNVMTSFSYTLIIIDKKTIKYYQVNCATVPDVALPCYAKTLLKGNKPECTNTVIIAIICAMFIFIAALIFCVAYDESDSTNTQANYIGLANSLIQSNLSSNHLESSFESKKLRSKVDVISGKTGSL